MLVTGASHSFTRTPIEQWTQRLDSPMGKLFMQVIAQKTGLSQQDITSQLQSGTSLHDILASKNVTFGEVRQTVLAQSGSVSSQSPAGQIQGAKRGHHHHGRHGGSGEVDNAIMGALANELGVQPSDLQQQLSDGKSLAQLASDKGVTASDLGAAVERALQSLMGYSASGAPAQATQFPATAANEAA
jgi:uncharacterized protein YidB (DUF937 family)